jgi:hypothetical protein
MGGRLVCCYRMRVDVLQLECDDPRDPEADADDVGNQSCSDEGS